MKTILLLATVFAAIPVFIIKSSKPPAPKVIEWHIVKCPAGYSEDCKSEALTVKNPLPQTVEVSFWCMVGGNITDKLILQSNETATVQIVADDGFPNCTIDNWRVKKDTVKKTPNDISNTF